MKTAWRRKLNHTNFDTSFVKFDQVLIILWQFKGEKYPFSFAVNHIEVIDHIDWLHNELNIYSGDLNHLSPHADFSYVILFFYS